MDVKKRQAQPKLADLQERLRAAGLRSTGPRVAVLRVLEATPTPLSHAELVEALGDAGFDRATLYRNLTDLAEAGLVVRSDLGDHVWRFELKREGEAHPATHPHFTCVDCGTIECLPPEVVRLQPSRKVPQALGSEAVEIHLRGRCDDCR